MSSWKAPRAAECGPGTEGSRGDLWSYIGATVRSCYEHSTFWPRTAPSPAEGRWAAPVHVDRMRRVPSWDMVLHATGWCCKLGSKCQVLCCALFPPRYLHPYPIHFYTVGVCKYLCIKIFKIFPKIVVFLPLRSSKIFGLSHWRLNWPWASRTIFWHFLMGKWLKISLKWVRKFCISGRNMV